MAAGNVPFGVDTTFGITPLAESTVLESRKTERIKIHRRRDELGDIRKLCAGSLIEADISISGEGAPNFAAVTTGNFGVNEVTVISAEVREATGDEHTTFSMEAKLYTNR